LSFALLVGWLAGEAVQFSTLKTEASICSETLAFTDSNPPVYELDLFLNNARKAKKQKHEIKINSLSLRMLRILIAFGC